MALLSKFFVSRRKLMEILDDLEKTSNKNPIDLDDKYWQFGNANAVNYIKYKLGIPYKSGAKR